MNSKKVIVKYIGDSNDGIIVENLHFKKNTLTETFVSQEVLMRLRNMNTDGIIELFEFASTSDIVANSNLLAENIKSKFDFAKQVRNSIDFFSNNNKVQSLPLNFDDFISKIEIGVHDDAICWKYESSEEWIKIISISEITGPKGDSYDDFEFNSIVKTMSDRIKRIEDVIFASQEDESVIITNDGFDLTTNDGYKIKYN